MRNRRKLADIFKDICSINSVVFNNFLSNESELSKEKYNEIKNKYIELSEELDGYGYFIKVVLERIETFYAYAVKDEDILRRRILTDYMWIMISICKARNKDEYR